MNLKQQSSQKKRKGHFRKWHRRFGIAASVFLLNLAITGVLLNHYETLNLHKSYITSSWLLDWYGIKSPQSVNCYESKQARACRIGEQLYLNENYWQDSSASILLFQEWQQEQLLVTSSSIYWLTNDLQLIEALAFSDELGSMAVAANIISNELIVETEEGDTYRFNTDFFGWEKTEILLHEKPQQTVDVSNDVQKDLRRHYRQRQITHLRFIQDLHSGTLFGLSGKIINDITALIILWLVISGFVTWYRRKNKR
ncbi:PepSY-associated TM helix domain-containing protein [Kangiella shandongensis]|uniref:PepSY-associated TM helix domain-containing protein n=1 Tax=Kangiella shandongensis TaxID=2763258 RepID=UPI001CC0BC51|nr:PepSY-associated TM helix domain-containing protein [Kangiella shandongensis]